MGRTQCLVCVTVSSQPHTHYNIYVSLYIVYTNAYTYMCVCVYIHICVYIYIYTFKHFTYYANQLFNISSKATHWPILLYLCTTFIIHIHTDTSGYAYQYNSNLSSFPPPRFSFLVLDISFNSTLNPNDRRSLKIY